MFNNNQIQEVKTIKILGVTFENDFSYRTHINEVKSKCERKVGLLSRLRHYLPQFALSRLYKYTIEPSITYCPNIWSFSAASHIQPLINLQKRAARLISFKSTRHSSEPLFLELKWQPITIIWNYHAMSMINKCLVNCCPEGITQIFKYKELPSRQMTHRSETNFDNYLVCCFTEFNKRFPANLFSKGCEFFNKLDIDLRSSESLSHFKKHFKLQHFINV